MTVRLFHTTNMTGMHVTASEDYHQLSSSIFKEHVIPLVIKNKLLLLSAGSFPFFTSLNQLDYKVKSTRIKQAYSGVSCVDLKNKVRGHIFITIYTQNILARVKTIHSLSITAIVEHLSTQPVIRFKRYCKPSRPSKQR